MGPGGWWPYAYEHMSNINIIVLYLEAEIHTVSYA